jgi:uncharacterized Fe-S cluster-containing radical SAM superfamily protein
MNQVLSPFDPIVFSSLLKSITCNNSMMKYTVFYRSGPYGGVSTGYASGCNLRCVFCWADDSRDEPERFGRFYSAEEAFEELMKNANPKGVKRLRLSGGEPTICRNHIFRLIELIQETDSILTLETNGMLFGTDDEYLSRLSKYRQLHVRISLKAGTPEGFQKLTGAQPDLYELPYNAIRHLIKNKISFHAAAMTDPRIMSADERSAIIKKLNGVGYDNFLEEEECAPYPHTIRRLKKAGLSIFAEEWTD